MESRIEVLLIVCVENFLDLYKIVDSLNCMLKK